MNCKGCGKPLRQGDFEFHHCDERWTTGFGVGLAVGCAATLITFALAVLIGGFLK